VVIDTSFAGRGASGTGVYLEQLVAALRRRGQIEVVEVRQAHRLRAGRSGRGWNPARSAVNGLLDLGWRQVGLPRAARRLGADVLHHPLPAHSRHAGCAQAITVHDVAFLRLPEAFDPLWRRVAARGHRSAVAQSHAVICVSASAAADAARLLEADPEWVVVALHGPGQVLPATPARPPEHLLFIGDAEPRKNLRGLLGAYERYRADSGSPLGLVLAGASATEATGEGVRGVHGPDAGKIADLLAGAAALVHPSLHEGFGLTLLEAMAAGVPVVAVRNPGAAEVCGDAALMVEAGNLAGAIESVATLPQLREDLVRRGSERARQFSWEESARRHEEAYTLARHRHERRGAG